LKGAMIVNRGALASRGCTEARNEKGRPWAAFEVWRNALARVPDQKLCWMPRS